MMMNWFLECGDQELSVENVMLECVEEIDRITQNCSSEAALSYSQGLEAAYSCYLEQGYCETIDDETQQGTVDEQMTILENCGALFEAEIEPFEQCIYHEDEIGSPQRESSMEPEDIPYEFYQENDIEKVHLNLEDDDSVVIETPFLLPFVDGNFQKLTIM